MLDPTTKSPLGSSSTKKATTWKNGTLCSTYYRPPMVATRSVPRTSTVYPTSKQLGSGSGCERSGGRLSKGREPRPSFRPLTKFYQSFQKLSRIIFFLLDFLFNSTYVSSQVQFSIYFQLYLWGMNDLGGSFLEETRAYYAHLQHTHYSNYQIL